MTSYLGDVTYVHEADAQVDGIASTSDVDKGDSEEDDWCEEVYEEGEETSPEQQRIERVPLALLNFVKKKLLCHVFMISIIYFISMH